MPGNIYISGHIVFLYGKIKESYGHQEMIVRCNKCHGFRRIEWRESYLPHGVVEIDRQFLEICSKCEDKTMNSENDMINEGCPNVVDISELHTKFPDLPSMTKIVNSIISGKWSKIIKGKFFENNPSFCLITGENASGKSLIRKIIGSIVQRKTELITTSMSQRCQSGLERAFIYGSEQEDSTGFNSIRTIVRCLSASMSKLTEHAVFIDEPEVGLSEECAAAVGKRVCEFAKSLNKCTAFFVTSHSRAFIKQLLPANPSHWRLGDDMNLESWLTRRIEPASISDILELGRKMWHKAEKLIKDLND